MKYDINAAFLKIDNIYKDLVMRTFWVLKMPKKQPSFRGLTCTWINLTVF
jgi:hypothetical protein